MSINSLELPATVIAEIYKNYLVEIQEKSNTGGQKIIPPPLKFLGENKSHILIVVRNPALAFVNDDELLLLVNMLNACKMSLADIALINMANITADYKEIISPLKSRIVFLFGVEPPSFGMPINFPMYQVQKFNHVSFIHAPPLNSIISDQMEKSRLWLTLQSIFSI